MNPRHVTVANLPAANSVPDQMYMVVDSLTPGDFTVGGGSLRTVVWSNGGGWAVAAGQMPLGSGAAAACAGNDSRLSDARVPTGNAGGSLTGSFPNPTIGANQVTNAMLAGSIDLTSKVANQLPFSNGGNAGNAVATSATTGTMTVNMTAPVITITPTGACTFNASGGVAGQIVTFLITTNGSSSFVLTFGTNFIAAGTLATGTSSGKRFSVTFRCVNGTTWQEICRTGAM